VWDAGSYYRQYEWHLGTVASHCRSWVSDEGSEMLCDLRMMFGCRAAANFAQRGSGFMAWLAQQALDRLQPTSDKVRRAFELMESSDAARADPASVRYRQAFVSQFIDDLPSVAVASAARLAQVTCASVWEVLGVEPQPKKVWPEGGYGPE